MRIGIIILRGVPLIPLILFVLSVVSAQAQSVDVSLLVTTDLHGNIYPYDYFTAKPAERGLAKIATLIAAERMRHPNSLLIDCGDTIQGAPLEAVYQNYTRTGRLPAGLHSTGKPPAGDPMMLAMNRLSYDAMVVGNHEYNFGLKNLESARGLAKFPWLSANTVTPASMKPFAPYIVKTVAGVKIAIIGITTPAVPTWEKPENYQGLKFVSGVEAVEKSLAELRTTEKPDLVIVAVHGGLDRDPKTGTVRAGETGFENPVYQIATKVRGIDAIIFGHTHQQLEDFRIGDVLLHQPKNWGISLGRVDFSLQREGAGWKVVSKKGTLIPVTAQVQADAAILDIAKPYHELTERWLDTPVAQSAVELDGVLARVEDTALVDAVQQVQLHYSKADVSMTAMFNPRAKFPKGPITVRQVAALYIYDNELYVVEGNGKMLRDALENAARYFATCPDPSCAQGALINRNVIGFNYDMAQGVEYEIDLTQPEGSRVRNLRYHGKPLEDTQPLRLAINNYRAGGSAGYTMFRNARVLWKSGDEIRDLVIEYFTERKALPSKPDNNWRIVPETARKRLEADARNEAARTANY